MIENFAATSLTLAEEIGLSTVLKLSELTEQNAVFTTNENRLTLHLILDGKPNVLSFDLMEGEIASRANRVSKSNEVVAKALGCKPHYRPKVLDATAGMGRDSLIMAMLGCNVVMQERNFAIYQLLKNALSRYLREQELSRCKEKQSLSLEKVDSIYAFQGIENIDVIYLDPMFPNRKKSALVKKEMRLFKLVAGEDQDSDILLLNALNSSAKRVVVKRPKGAPVLANRSPDHEILGKKFRYDVYLLQN